MIESLIITELKQFNNEKGSIYHGMRQSDQGYQGFEEIYFSFIKTGIIRKFFNDMLYIYVNATNIFLKYLKV